MNKLLDAAIAIANYCEVGDVERGGAASEIYIDPNDKKQKDNCTFVPVKLLNALREAAKESPYYKDPMREKREREIIDNYMWEKSPGQGCS